MKYMGEHAENKFLADYPKKCPWVKGCNSLEYGITNVSCICGRIE
jgi:hypothetical protein